jgi:hypothetical protein
MPVAGGAKTRLAREIGVGAATRFARQATAALLQRVAHDQRWQTILAVSPDAGLASRQVWRAAAGRGASLASGKVAATSAVACSASCGACRQAPW